MSYYINATMSISSDPFVSEYAKLRDVLVAEGQVVSRP